jgi:hypothetical protein
MTIGDIPKQKRALDTDGIPQPILLKYLHGTHSRIAGLDKVI